ncbi:WXG100 family type VII secretion target [Streptomyces sp. bgisy159]|uniref:WXG100 family type VII secretion target n=1 Tax=Streptomyces sp. bgisy159 TaxID=3413795 RepID=UPI003F49FB66
MSGQATGSPQGATPDLKVTRTDLTKLAGDLGDMGDHLDQQVTRMDAIVDRIEAGWRGPAGTVYREFHRAAAEDAVRIREVVKVLQQAVLLSRDGFSETDLDVLHRIRQVHVDISSEVGRLSTPDPQAAPQATGSALDAY